MSFRSVFIALVIGFALLIGAFLINRQRPAVETDQASPALVRASGKCAECHSRQQVSIVHEYQLSAHARAGINCLDCHQPADKQKGKDHHGFTISEKLTAGNCRRCHEPVYQQFLRSRHAIPSWTAVYGGKDIPAELVKLTETYHAGTTKRDAHPLVGLEGPAAGKSGCASCHSIGKPNADETVGSCTACHTRHTSSVSIARQPRTCGQCHMGPDHSQIEIFEESKHGVMFNAQKHLLNLAAAPAKLTTRDMFIPTCATCHLSGLNGLKTTHDTSERLSYWLADPITKPRPHYAQAQAAMKEVCLQCHTRPVVDRVYAEAEDVVTATNAKVHEAEQIILGLRKEGLLSDKPFRHPIDFKYFDLWHYYGRTAKHGAFMGGADFIQWHGNYPMLTHLVDLKAMAKELRGHHGKSK